MRATLISDNGERSVRRPLFHCPLEVLGWHKKRRIPYTKAIMAKRTQQMLFRLILVLGAAASAAAQEFRIAEGERAEIHFAAGSAPLKYAATELGRYLDIITRSSEGVSPGPKRFVLLRDERKELGEDGFELAVTPEEFKITGSDLGVVFGIFHLLKTFGGCKFAGLGADGEYIPRSGEFRAPVGTYREVPSLWYRGLQLSWREPLELVIQRLDWMVRNGMNYLMYWCVAGEVDDPVGGTISDEEKFIPERARLHIPEEWFDRYVLPEIEKRGIKIDFNHHNLHYWLPPEKYYERHPEWYALRKGKRSRVTDHKQFAICTSNPEAVGELVSNVLAFLEKRPSVRIVGVVPEDGIGACECQGCASQDHFDSEITKRYEGDQSKTAGNINKTRRYERLIRAVASAVGERFPERLVGHAAYNDVRFPLVSEKMPTNVVTWVAMGGRDSASPIVETSPHDFNRFLHALLGEWRKNHNGKVILYEYYMGLDSMRSLPFPMWDVIGRDWESLKKLGVAGATVQCWATNHETYALNLLAFAEAGWGGEKSSDTLLDDYLVGRFLGMPQRSSRGAFDRRWSLWCHCFPAPGRLCRRWLILKA